MGFLPSIARVSPSSRGLRARPAAPRIQQCCAPCKTERAVSIFLSLVRIKRCVTAKFQVREGHCSAGGKIQSQGAVAHPALVCIGHKQKLRCPHCCSGRTSPLLPVQFPLRVRCSIIWVQYAQGAAPNRSQIPALKSLWLE